LKFISGTKSENTILGDYTTTILGEQHDGCNLSPPRDVFITYVSNRRYLQSVKIKEKQIECILDEYINYYNSKRPHQGINQKVPRRYEPQLYGKVQKLPILGGLHHHYIRSAA